MGQHWLLLIDVIALSKSHRVSSIFLMPSREFKPVVLLPEPSMSKEEATEKRNKSIEYHDTQIDSVNSFAVVATLLFGAAISEFSSFVPKDWPVVMGRVYAVIAAMSVAGSLYSSVISVFVVATVQRMKIWDVAGWPMMDTEEKEELFRKDHGLSRAAHLLGK